MSCAGIGIIMHYVFDMILKVMMLTIPQGALLHSSILDPLSLPLFTLNSSDAIIIWITSTQN
jgi:hypothetical protein